MVEREKKKVGLARIRRALEQARDLPELEAILGDLEEEIEDMPGMLVELLESSLEAGDERFFPLANVVRLYFQGHEGAPEALRLVRAIADLPFRPGLDDRQRLHLLSLAADLGCSYDPRDIAEAFENFPRSLGEAFEDAMAKVKPFQLVAMLRQQIEDTPARDVRSTATALAGQPGRAPAFGLAFLAEHPDDGVARAAIAGLGRSDDPMARWFLERMARYAWRNTAPIREALDAVRARAVPCPRIPVPEARMTASVPDGRGSLVVLLETRESDGTASVTILMLNDLVGMKDSHGFEETSPGEYDRVVSEMASAARLAPIDRDALGALVRHALWVARRNRKPLSMDFSARQALLGDLEPEPARHEPDLSAYPAHAGADLLAGTGDLFHRKPYDRWWYESPASYAFVRDLPPARRLRPQEADTDAFLRTFYAPQRERFADRLGWTLELSARHGRAPEPEAAARLYRALADASIPMERIPFFREASAQSIALIGRSLALGVREPEDYSEQPLP